MSKPVFAGYRGESRRAGVKRKGPDLQMTTGTAIRSNLLLTVRARSRWKTTWIIGELDTQLLRHDQSVARVPGVDMGFDRMALEGQRHARNLAS